MDKRIRISPHLFPPPEELGWVGLSWVGMMREGKKEGSCGRREGFNKKHLCPTSGG